MHWYIDVLKKYAVFSGRARRKEYWFFALINWVISMVLYLIDIYILTNISESGFTWLSTIYALAVVIPGLAVFVRRLHDTNRSGWWFFIAFIPLIGAIVLLVFVLQNSTPGENKYGPNPKEVPALVTQ